MGHLEGERHRPQLPAVPRSEPGVQQRRGGSLSDAEGTFAFPDLEFGSYAITPTLAGYTFVPPNWQVSLPQDDTYRGFVYSCPPRFQSQPATQGITTTLTYTDVQGLPTSFTIPAGRWTPRRLLW